MKNHFNEGSRSADSDLPRAINVATTFAIICRFLLAEGSLGEITSMPQDKLLDGIGQLANQTWLPRSVNELLASARHLIQQR